MPHCSVRRTICDGRYECLAASEVGCTVDGVTIETERLLLRRPVEADRKRFVEMFTDDEFMVFGARLNTDSANARFDDMLDMSELVAYAKQPIVERASGTIMGYTGVGVISFDGAEYLEWGWRLLPAARGKGFATEAVKALLALADGIDHGKVLCFIEPDNAPSRSVADKVGFDWWKHADWNGDADEPTDVLVRPIGAGGPKLQAPSSQSTARPSPSVISRT